MFRTTFENCNLRIITYKFSNIYEQNKANMHEMEGATSWAPSSPPSMKTHKLNYPKSN